MDEWCTANCNANFCPGAMCVCKTAPMYPNYSVYPQTLPWNKIYPQQVDTYNSNNAQRYPMAAILRAQPQTQPEVAHPSVVQPRGIPPTIVRTVRAQPKTPAPVTLNHDHPSLQNRIKRIQKQARSIQRNAVSRRGTGRPAVKRRSQKVVEGSVFQKDVSSARLASQKKIVSTANKYLCKATGRYTGLPQFDDWCHNNCMKVICPLLICECRAQ